MVAGRPFTATRQPNRRLATPYFDLGPGASVAGARRREGTV